MEHSLLHGLQLCGLIFALGGALFRFLVTNRELDTLVQRWIFRAAIAGAVACGCDLLVQVAEIEGRTIYGGVDLSLLKQFVVQTAVGKLAVTKAALFGIAICLAKQKIPLLLVLLALAVCTGLVSHAAAVPQGSGPAVVGQILHILGVAVWLGMLGFILLSVSRFPAECQTLIKRFSTIALTSVVLIAISGAYSVWRFIYTPEAIIRSAYGLTFLLKMALLLVVICSGFKNWRSAQPQRSHIELEFTAGVLVVLVAGVLGSIPLPAQDGSAQLSATQGAAVLSPELPSARLPDAASFVGAPMRTTEDLLYSEFTHRWSGVFVMLLGVAWLKSLLWSHSRRIWPFILILFGLFISAIADPEVWMLRTFSFWQIVSNPEVLEHQIGAIMVFVLAWFGFRDAKRPVELRPLGCGFPLVVMVASLMLLGHAHTTLAASEELRSLINFQHAIMGALGLIAGTCRWFEIRQLPGARAFRYTWAPCIILLGAFMTFFYTEFTPECDPSSNSSISEYVPTT